MKRNVKKLFVYRVNCIDQNGDYRGLLEILKDLHLINADDEDSNYTLPKLREILNTHPAFDEENTALNQIANSYNGKIIWTPKFHCELNPIEGRSFLLKL